MEHTEPRYADAARSIKAGNLTQRLPINHKTFPVSDTVKFSVSVLVGMVDRVNAEAPTGMSVAAVVIPRLTWNDILENSEGIFDPCHRVSSIKAVEGLTFAGHMYGMEVFVPNDDISLARHISFVLAEK